MCPLCKLVIEMSRGEAHHLSPLWLFALIVFKEVYDVRLDDGEGALAGNFVVYCLVRLS